MSNLYQAYQAAIEENPKSRARDLAQTLNVSEGALVACRQGVDTWQLKSPFQDLLSALEPLGDVMTITRNDEVVHECHGIYNNVRFMGGGNMGLVLTPEIDLRLFMSQWFAGFLVSEKGRDSLQFFNKQGMALHKIYRTDRTNVQAWEELVDAYRLPVGDVEFDPVQTVKSEAPVLPADFDSALFAKEWSELKDVHEYHGMLKRHKLSRTQALEQIGPEWATKIHHYAVVQAIQFVQEESSDVMIFVGNSGCIQIYTGAIQKLMPHGPWFNVLDERFNLHLRTDLVDQVWVIERPSSDGVITSIEAFNKQGDSIITLFGRRKPGEAELPQWRDIVHKVKAHSYDEENEHVA
ncbi:hemin-degrading factor [Marinomonas transparens]|uniref:Haemin-degrading HemS/ChuX domain-containing protein n=1 Tax=Marinomonas transparens TaxID=2795388 RepID=A0A934MZU8_9GAMM|nr:ChuX/HutX family heme-like substrate-binding protein [Marinomonas transparens]MBJ7537925.1 hypothetical protein [Marinomonas transparens]